MKLKSLFAVLTLLLLSTVLYACNNEADTVNHNISKSADNFEVERRIVFLNGITDKYLFTIEGKCSLDVQDNNTLRVTCKVGDEEYKRHYLGLSDNVTYFVEQVEGKKEDPYRYKVVFRPEALLSDIEIKAD